MTETLSTPYIPEQRQPEPAGTSMRLSNPWIHIAAAAVIGAALGAGLGGMVGAAGADEQKRIALAANERASDAARDATVAENRAKADVTEAEVKAEEEVAQAKADAEAAVAERLAEAERIRGEAEAAAAATRADLDAQKASLDARAAAVTGQEAEAKKNEFEGSGIYRVGEDIAPGTYKAEASGGCYYARLSSLTAGGIDGIIDNNNVDGPVVIVVRPSDVGLEVSGCGTFRKVG